MKTYKIVGRWTLKDYVTAKATTAKKEVTGSLQSRMIKIMGLEPGAEALTRCKALATIQVAIEKGPYPSWYRGMHYEASITFDDKLISCESAHAILEKSFSNHEIFSVTELEEPQNNE